MASRPKKPTANPGKITRARPAASTPLLTAVKDATAAEDGNTVRKKAMIDRVTEASGVKRKDAKAVLEATLAELGKAIAAGEELNLPGLGKIKVNRTQEQANGTVYICKIRQPSATDKADVAETAEDKAPETADA